QTSDYRELLDMMYSKYPNPIIDVAEKESFSTDSSQNGSVLPKTPSSLEQDAPIQRFVTNFLRPEILSKFNFKSFSAIVGSNGSGKSNVIDALLFGVKNLDACRVDVYFEEILELPGSDNYEVLPQAQLVISHQAFRNNASKYFINGRQSNYTE
ncbi:8366_t:CDS:2, partial [Funneliformis caledonium]